MHVGVHAAIGGDRLPVAGKLLAHAARLGLPESSLDDLENVGDQPVGETGRLHLALPDHDHPPSQGRQRIDGARFDLAAGSSLKITGGKAKVGFDGGDGKTATLQLHDDATLSFVANATGLGKISEFYSGAFDTSKVTSGIRLDGDLKIDLAGLNTQKGGSWTLIDADQIIGSFDDISVSGLGRNRDALIRIDYVKDEVVLLISDAGKGSGQIRTSSTGEADFIDYTKDAALKALWADLQASMPLVTDDPI